MEKSQQLIVYAIHDFQAENPDELSFSAGEAIEVTEKDDLYGDGWWQGRNTKGQFGLFPQAYTIPAPSVASGQQLASSANPSATSQPTMHETLFEVQNAIDQLHHPSRSTSSLPPPSPLTTESTKPSKEADDDNESSHIHPHSNPAQARAILAQKAQADSYNNSHAMVMEKLKSASNQFHPTHRTSLNSLVSVPGIGDIELSEESDSEDDDHDSLDNHGIPPSGSSTLATTDIQASNSKSTQLKPISPTFHPSAPKLTHRQSSDCARQTAFKPGPFSAAAIALGLTGSPKDKDKEKNTSFQKGHHHQKPSSSSLLSDMGLDLREHFNLVSAPVASTLRMSRESSQFTNLPTLTDLNNRIPNSAPSDIHIHPNGPTTSTSRGPDAEPSSPLERLSDTVAIPTGTPLATRSQENLKVTSSDSHQRKASACSTGNGIFPLHQQHVQPANPFQPIVNDSKASVSTADSSSVKGSRSRSSSHIEQFVSIEDQPTSPATSNFPSSAGARQGDGSFSSSHSRPPKPFGFASFSSAFPDQWTVNEVSEWAKAKGLDEFTVAKFIEHEITGDVLLELDVNALKEIDLTAFGRRVKVIKAIEELKKTMLVQKPNQPSPLSPLSDGIHHLASSSLGSSLQPSPLPNSRKEFGTNHGVRLSVNAKQDYSPYQKAYHASVDLPPGNKRTSSGAGVPLQTNFVIPDGSQTKHQRNQSKATIETKGRSRASSWAPVTDIPENDLTDIVQGPAELAEPIVLAAPETNVDEKPKKVKKKKLRIQKAPGIPTSVKNRKDSFESPDACPLSPDSPGKSHEPPNTKSRTSFLGNLRGRKPPPKLNSQSPVNQTTSTNQNAEGEGRPGSSSGLPPSINGRTARSLFHFGQEKVQGQAQHQIQHLSPLAESKNAISSPLPFENKEPELPGAKNPGETRTALERIGTPDHMGWMRKKGEKYPTWKLRYFILKGPNLYYLKAENQIRIKGLIKLTGFKVLMDADVHPGRYGFRIIHDNGSTHLFSADDSKLLRDWMKAMMKATIDRDWVAPVISSCNIRTIPIREAQKMFPPPRPPSPQSRARVQKARMTANPDLLTDKDAAVLMSLQTLQQQNTPSTPPFSPVANHSSADTQLRPRRSVYRPSPEKLNKEFSDAEFSSTDKELLTWINVNIKHHSSLQASDFSGSIRNGLVLVRLIESLTSSDSGLNDQDFMPLSTLNDEAIKQRGSVVERDEDFDIFFSIFDYLNSQKIPLAGYSLNDLISGDPHKTRDFFMRIYNKFTTMG
ncbi:uncharacterized protein VP01_316g11 [Puccinia sorghi]|uniref:Polar growth protein n=1 Tax=Puccinia sorghi TaxID=27349 RepID=A0A0L6UYN4_9BASI|nr:uncharacterized protein VP01_316g11 [Puccinia sorghi]